MLDSQWLVQVLLKQQLLEDHLIFMVIIVLQLKFQWSKRCKYHLKTYEKKVKLNGTTINLNVVFRDGGAQLMEMIWL
tara:strand:- start:292 stop:522 length:231 start_codon:yes stop_codon:yes gene_type:complete